jgi:hypothetical protein
MSFTEITLTKSYPSIQLLKSAVASEAFQVMADATIYGTPGKMRYAHVKSVEKIKTLQHTSFLEFKRNDQTLGIVALVGHQLHVAKQRVSGLYVRYFSMNTPMRSDRQRAKKEGEKRGVLHHMIKELFDEPEKLTIESLGEKAIVYAFVESTNERSLNMVKSMGFQPSRQLVTLLFSRFYPNQKLKIVSLSEEQIPQIKELLHSYYKDYNLVHDFNESWENYYIHEVEGEVICGVKLETNTWRIFEMPGFDGWLFRNVLPRVPILNRIFQKDKIDFIGIERLYIRPSHEYLLPDFLETLCAQFGVTKAMIGVDNKSPLHHLLKTKGKLGLLDKLITPSPGWLFSRTYGLKDEEVQSLHDQPFYVSTYELS